MFGELPDLPHVPELPGRGPGADLTGRACGLLAELAVDLQPAGWRLTSAPGSDQGRARSMLAWDLDAVEEVLQGYAGALKLAVCGPWTLASTVELPRGGRALADRGARRDLAHALAEGLVEHVADVRRRVPGAVPVVQFDEPGLPAVLAGTVPTASGYSRYRPVEEVEALELLTDVLTALRKADPDVPPAVHCCAPDVPVALLCRAGIRAIGFDLSLAGSRMTDELAAAVEAGVALFVGAVPALPPDSVPSDAEVAREVLGFWRRLGFADETAAGSCVVTPRCGLAGADPGWARDAMALSREAARVVGEGG